MAASVHCEWGRGHRGNNAACSALTLLSVTSPAPTSKLNPSGADSWVYVWICVCSRTPWVSPTNSPVRLGFSSTTATPTGFYNLRFGGFLFPCWNPVFVVYLALHLFLLVYLHAKVGLPASATATWSSSCCLGYCSLHPGCPSSPLLRVWMNVSSLTPWLLDFHTVQFSASSCCFLFLTLLLCFFQLWKEANCISLHLHLGWKS